MKDLFQARNLDANQRSICELLRSVTAAYVDVDGTLVGPRACFFLDADACYTLKPAQALVSAHKSSLDIVMVSGRNRLQLLEDARLLGTKNYIAELGCQIVYDLGKEIVLNPGGLLAVDPGNSIFQTIAASGAVELLFDTFTGCLEYHTPWSDQRECTHLFRGYIDIDHANKALKSNHHEHLKIVDNGVIGRHGTLKELPETHAYHLLPAGCGKSEAVRKDREIRGIPRESAVAIGDAASDLVLANEVGAFFLVKNALLKDSTIDKEIERFDNVYITNEQMGLGFAQVIDFMLKAR